MKKIEKLTKKQIALQEVVRDEWIDIALRRQDTDEEEIIAGVKWMYYISNFQEPKVVIVKGPKDFAKRFKKTVWDSVWDSVGDSVGNSVGDSVRASVWDSVWASVRNSVGDSVRNSVGDSVGASVWDSVRASVWASVRNSVGNSVGDSVGASVWDSVWASVRASVWDSVGWMNLSGDAEFGAWYEYWTKIEAIEPQEKAEKYIGYLRAGAFYTFFFERMAYVMLRPTIVEQDERKRLHSTTGPALAFADGTEIYKLHGVEFEKKWWNKIVNDKMSPEEVFAIDNLEHRRIAYEYMDKTKMKSLKDYQVLDEVTDDGKGNPMKIISFKVKGIDKPLKYLNCLCPSTGREYFLGTDKDKCWEAKKMSFGLEGEVEWVDEW